jgi:crotonobetainyl-CoA:carnitine CoA-transferase CaiB-like acyl-CoA transferase
MTDEAAALAHAGRLIAELGCDARPVGPADHPALSWRRSGLMAVTGEPGGEGLMCPAALTAAADGALMALKALAPDPGRLPTHGALLLGERARMMGLQAGGRVSANGSCRLLAFADGVAALNLARPEDWGLLPVLLGCDTVSGWTDVERRCARLGAEETVALGIELGLPIALDQPPRPVDRLFQASEGRRSPPTRRPYVVDLSSLWAGPLAGSLLAMAGAEVVKLEAVDRPDGARRGHRAFFDLLNGGKRSVALDFSDPEGRARLRALIERADIVIEGSRPRALRRLGIDRAAAVARGAVWIAITAHDDPDRVGFGDDAAVEAGLATMMRQAWGQATFVGDAVADPLTGLHAALGGWAAWQAGGGRLVSLSLSRTVGHAIGAGVATGGRLGVWRDMAHADRARLFRLRAAGRRAAEHGADTDAVLAPC